MTAPGNTGTVGGHETVAAAVACGSRIAAKAVPSDVVETQEHAGVLHRFVRVKQEWPYDGHVRIRQAVEHMAEPAYADWCHIVIEE